MPIYQVQAPDNRVYNVEGPENADPNTLIATLHQHLSAAPSTQRTPKQNITDPLLSIGVGVGNLAQIPGQVATLTGATSLGGALSKPGEVITDYFKSLQSEGLKARQALANKAMSDAEKEGVLSEFATAIKQTVTDPALLSTFVFEQLPMLLGPQAAATVTTKLGVKGLQTAATVEAKELAKAALAKKATAAAVGTGAGMQGADVGSDTYKEALKLLKEQYPDMSPEEREKIALNKGRVAALEAAAISVAAGRLPGASALEKRMAGLPGAGRVKTAAGQSLNEIIEEGGGKFASNVGLQEIDPTRSLTQGVGTAAGLGAVGGGTLGGILGGRTAAAPAPGTPGTQESPINRVIAAEAAAAEAKAKTEAEAAAQAAAGAPTVTKKGRKGKAAAVAPEATVKEEPVVAPTILDEEKLVDIGVKKNKSAKTAFSVLNGADVSDPAQLPKILAVLRGQVKYHTEKGDTERVAKIQSFIDDITPAAPVTEAPVAEVPAAPVAPVETPVAPTIAEDQNVAAPIGEPVGASASVVSEPIVPAAPEGVAEAQPVGVVPTEQDADAIAGREGQQPAALTEAPAPVPEVPTTERMSDDSNGVIKSVIERVGVYNSPSSSLSQRYNATDTIYAIATDKETPKAAKDFALRALKNAIDPSDMRPSLRGKYDETVKDVPEDDTPWGSYKNVAEVGTPEANAIAAATATPEFVAAVNAGKTRKAIQEIFNTSPDNSIIKLVAEKLLKASTLPKLSVAPRGVLRGKNKENIVGEYNAAKDAARLDEDVLTPSNLIHEVIHGFFATKIDMYLKGNLDAQIKRVDDLYQHLLSEYPQLKKQYGMTNLQEFVAEAMSNSEFQKLLKDIPYKKSNYFREFAKAVLRVLGITDKVPAWNAAAEALLSVEVAMDSGRALQESRAGYYVDTLPGASRKQTDSPDILRNITPGAIAATTQANIIGETVDPTLRSKLKKFKDTKLTRTGIVDSASSVIDKIFTGYAGQLRDATGEIIPTEHIAQALDATRIAERSIVEGGVSLTQDGLFTATSLGNLPTGEEISARGINKIIVNSAKRAGLTFEEGKKVFDSELAAHREHEIDIHNNRPTTKVRITLRIKPLVRQVLEAEFQNNAEAQKVAKIMDIMRFNRIDALVAAGRITPKKAQFWKDVTGYVPFQSMDALIEKMEQSTGTGKGIGKKTTYFSIEGGSDQLASVVDTFQIKMADMVVDAIKTNAVSKASRTLVRLGHAKMVNPLAKISKEEESRSTTTYVNGVYQRFIYNDPLDAVAFAAMPSVVSSSVEILQTMSRLLRTSVTWGFKFAIGQVLHDVTRAYGMSDVNHPAALIPRILLNFPRATIGELTGNKRPVQRKLENLGVMSTVDTGTRGTVKSIQIEVGARNRNAMDLFLHLMESIAKGSDAAVRIALYEQSMEETNDEALSLYRAREIINFSRRGSNTAIDFLIRTVPFTNAYIRGMDKLYDTARLTTTGKGGVYNMAPSRARRMFATRALTIAGTWAVYSMMMSDDEEYQALDDSVRDNNIIIPSIRVGDSPLAIPLPRDLAYIYKAIPERLISYYNKYGTEEEQSILRVTGELLRQGGEVLLSPGVVPSGLVPFIETFTNYSFFLGRSLESAAQQRQAPSERFGRGTSELAKEAGQMLDMSPIKIDNFIRGFFGTMGALVLGITDKIIDPERTEGADKKDMLVQLTGLSNLMIDPVGRKQLNALYKLEEKVSQIRSKYYKEMERDPVAAAAYGTKNEKYLIAYNHVQYMFKKVQNLNTVIKTIDADKRITATERQKYIAMTVKEQNDIAKGVSDAQAYLDNN